MNNYDILKNDIEKNINDLVNDLDLKVENTKNSLKNDFINWMNTNNFEPKTISNYVNSINIVSREAINENILDREIFEITELSELDKLIGKLNNNDTYLNRKAASHNTNTAAMSAYRKFVIDYNKNEDEIESVDILDKFKEYYYANIDEYKNNEEAIESINLRSKFVNEYPIDRWKILSLDEYALGTDNFLDSLSYKLEFGEYKHTGMGIGGGSSSKHGIYYSKNSCYRGYKNEVIANPQEYWNNFRNQIYDFLNEIRETNKFPEIDQRYSVIKTIPLLMAKLCFLYFPSMFISIGSRGKLQTIIDLFNIESSNDNISSKMSFDICNYFKECFSERLSDDPQWLGYGLWRFIAEIENNEENELEFETENGNNEIDIEEYDKQKFLNEVFIEESKYDSIVSILNKKKNIILEGAPGVGKTFMAKRLAYSIIGAKDEDKVKLIQFHQSYSYEDFVEGYRPFENGFKLEKGLFYDMCLKAESNPKSNYYLIIDEINRGNMSKIFGELLMLIESDKRGEKLNLAYSGNRFSVPENLYIIGLMNTADRSLALIDYALRRRFSFINIEPAFDNLKFIESFKNKFDNDYNNIIDIIKKINEAIEQDKSLGAGFKIGHSYFCPNLKDRKGNIKDIEDIIKYEIIPLLEEYWYDDPDSIIQWKEALIGAIND